MKHAHLFSSFLELRAESWRRSDERLSLRLSHHKAEATYLLNKPKESTGLFIYLSINLSFSLPHH